jgi:predicted HicB family RNase H-like nuclease
MKDRSFVVVKVPRSLWQLFHMALQRDEQSMQGWVNQVIRAELGRDAVSRVRGAIPANMVGFMVRESVAAYVPAPSAGPLAVHKPKRAAMKQVIARMDTQLLDRVRSRLERQGLTLTEWIQRKVTEYVAGLGLRMADLLPPRVVHAIKDQLPENIDAREPIAQALLDWPEEVILRAAADPSYGLADAVGTADIDLLSEILAVTAKGIDLEKAKRALTTKQARDRHPQ